MVRITCKIESLMYPISAMLMLNIATVNYEIDYYQEQNVSYRL